MKQTSRWTVLVLIFLLMIAFGLVFQSVPPILTMMITSLGLTHAQAGALMSLFALPGIFVSLPGGILATAYGAKKVTVASLVVVLAGTVMVGVSTGFPLLVTGRFIAGIGAITIAVAAPQTLSLWFADKELGIAFSVYNLAMPIATILAFNTFGTLAKGAGWPLPFWLTAAYCLIILILFVWKYPSRSDVEPANQKPDMRGSLAVLTKAGWPVWLISLVWMVYNTSSISFMTFAGDYFISKGYSVALAGFLTSLFMVASIVLAPVIGLIIDRKGKHLPFIVFGCTALAAMIFLVTRSRMNPVLLVLLIGISSVFIPTPLLSLLPRYLPAGFAGLGYGLSSALANLGVLAGPYLFGLLYDRSHSHDSGFDLLAAVSLLGAFLTLMIPLVLKKKKGAGSSPD